MDFFFSARSIALIGASPNPFKGGNFILKNLIATFRGDIYPVNPKYKTIEGLPCYAAVREIPDAVDMAIIFVPAREVPQAVRDCADKKIPGVIIESAGFAEIGAEGDKLQNELLDIKKQTGIRLWGPNCMGMVDGVQGHVFSFMVPEAVKSGLIPGHVSLIVQSGMLSGGFLMDIVSNRITGINKVCSVGNKIDVDECDLLEYFEKDPQTKVIGLYLESIVDGRRFLELCKKSSKPIVVLKGGKSASGAQAARSHTAALAGNHRVIEDALQQAGVIEAQDFKQLVDLCRSLAVYSRRPKGVGRVAILTASGGAGIVASDFIEEYNLSLAKFTHATKSALEKLFPHWMPVNNPVDIWPAIENSMGKGLDVYRESLRALLADKGVDAVLICGFAGNSSVSFNMADIAEKSRQSGKPIFIWLFGLRDAAFAAQTQAREHGVMIFQELQRASECLAAVLHQKNKKDFAKTAAQRPARPRRAGNLQGILESTRGILDEYLSKKILRACGFPTVKEKMATSLKECKKAAAALGYPLVMKGIMPSVMHKTEKGLIYKDIKTLNEAQKIYLRLTKKMRGKGFVLLQKQITGYAEIIMGMTRDAHFGPAVMLGVGGVMTEIFQQSVFGIAPLTRAEAIELINRFPARKLLTGFRGNLPVDKNKLAQLLVTLGEISLAHPRIKEIDINPLIIAYGGVIAVDATIVLD
ncbi:MAG TPA: acetate--CoA ligase family protein [Smithellaceae bacterium]|nr:acetate--CoA ligase family protein [Smithellaceae bacterium]HRS88435.1 acetate--CoA ligase family protein [Smithellaceae bacterium]HRV25491.1 acetate--CoA ligase family protein [Smithellaceae bacterium]